MSSHNVNGWKNSREFLHSRCEDENHAIFAIQEHWLKPAFRKQQGVNQLKFLHPRYDGFGISAMNKQISTEILKGRPFGGTGFLYSKNLSLSVRPCPQYNHDRVSVMELASKKGKILLVNAYLPFYDTRNLQSQTELYKETIAYMESIVHNNSGCSFIFLMDMNCNVYNSTHAFSKIMRDFMISNDLVSAFDFIPSFDSSSEYTRCDTKTKSYTLIDGILLSRSLSDMVLNASISHYGNNVSDHSPVEMKMSIDVDLFQQERNKPTEYIPWSSLSTSDLERYSETMERELKNISVPFHSLLHGSKRCNDTNHINLVERYYNDLLNAIQIADSVLPRKKHGVSKHYWSEELTRLKHQSTDAFNLWNAAGRPRTGATFLEKNSAQLQYKRALRRAKNDSDSFISNELSYNLLSRDSNKFWMNWNKIESRNSAVSCIDDKISHKDIANTFARTFSQVYTDVNHASQSALKVKFEQSFLE